MSEKVPGQNWYDGVTGFFGLDAESTISGRKIDPVTGRPKAGFGDTLLGRSQAELDAAYDTMRTTERRKKGKTAFEESGYSASDLDIDPDKTTVGQVRSAVRRVQEEKDEKTRKTNLQDTLTLTTAQQAPQLEELRSTNARLLQQGEQSHQLALLQLQENSQQNIRNLEYQKIRDRKADQQYNERMEQLDRKDRRTAMSSIAAGLASLGAAFAL